MCLFDGKCFVKGKGMGTSKTMLEVILKTAVKQQAMLSYVSMKLRKTNHL